MIAERIDMKNAQQRLGHSDVTMTLGLCAKVIESADRSVRRTSSRHGSSAKAHRTGNASDGRAMDARKGVTRGAPQCGRKRH
jgi:hypothetical protein